MVLACDCSLESSYFSQQLPFGNPTRIYRMDH
jgi:hypothetical protein